MTFLKRYVVTASAICAVLCFGIVSNTNAALGVCDTGNNVEIESTGGTFAGIPTGYATLAAAFNSVNAGVMHLGVVNIEVCGNTVEAAPATLLQVAGVTSLSIKPAGGAARTVQGNMAATLLNLNGVDNVTIDGLNSGGNSLTLSNTSTSSAAGTATLRFINDSSLNTVTRTTILGSSTSALDTVAATIIVGTGTTSGNDNNFVTYCNVGPAGANLPSKSLIGSGTSTSIENDNFRITNSNIYDHFLATGSSAGINVLAGNEGWWIASNRMYQTAARTFTAAAVRFSMVRVNSANNGAFIINSNVIGFTNSSGTGTMSIGGLDSEFRGIALENLATGTPAGVNYNTIAGISMTSSATNPFYGIDMNAGASHLIGNTIGSANGTAGITLISNSGATVGGFYGIRSASTYAQSILNNNIGYIYVQGAGSGGSDFWGIHAQNNLAAAANVQENLVTNVSLMNAGTLLGIFADDSAVVSGNMVRDLSATSPYPVSLQGIVTIYVPLVSQNTIHSLSLNITNSTAPSGVSGLLTLPGDVVARNFVHSLSVTSALADPGLLVIAGIGGSATVFKNNMVRLGIDAAGNSITTPVRIIGLNPVASGIQYFHNSVYIGGSNVVDAGGPTKNGNSACIENAMYTITMKNNVFWNARSNSSSGGNHYAEFMNSSFTSDYNVLRATGTGGQIGRFGGVNYSTLAAWQTATGGDYHSTTGNPQFANATGNATAVNLHILVTFFPTSVEGAGTSVAAVTDDFDGHIRSGLTPTDIGADAGNF